MGDDKNNNQEDKERRAKDRRVDTDRRIIIRFGDVLGRRTGVERRLTVRQ